MANNTAKLLSSQPDGNFARHHSRARWETGDSPALSHQPIGPGKEALVRPLSLCEAGMVKDPRWPIRPSNKNTPRAPLRSPSSMRHSKDRHHPLGRGHRGEAIPH